MSTFTNKNHISSIMFSVISFGLGFWLSRYDSMVTRIRSCLLIISIILFAVVLIGVAALSPFVRKKYGSKATPLHKSQRKSLILVAALLIIAINLIEVLPFAVIKISIMRIIDTIAFACMIYSLICEFDVLLSLIVVAKSQFRKESGK